MAIEITQDCDENKQAPGKVIVRGSTWSLDGTGENTLVVHTLPEHMEWTFDGPGQTNLTIHGIPKGGKWKLTDLEHTAGNINLLRVIDADQWVLTEMDPDATKLTIYGNPPGGRWVLADVASVDNLLGELTVHTIPEDGEWIFKETQHSSNSLTIHGIPDAGKWKLFDEGHREGLLSSFDTLNNMYIYDITIYDLLSRDYRFIKDKDNLVKYLKKDFKGLYDFVFVLNRNKPDIEDVEQLYLYKNIEIRKTNFDEVESSDCKLIYKTYPLSDNQRLFINLKPSDIVEDDLIDVVPVESVFESPVPAIDHPPTTPEHTTSKNVSFPGYFGAAGSGVFTEPEEDDILFDHIHMILPSHSTHNQKIHIVHESGLFDLSIINENIQKRSSEKHIDIFDNITFTTKHANTRIDTIGSTIHLSGNQLVSFKDIENILNERTVKELTLDINNIRLTTSERLNTSYAIVSGFEDDNPFIIKQIINKDGLSLLKLNKGEYNIKLFDKFNKKGISFNLRTFEDYNLQINLSNYNTTIYKNISHKNLLIYVDNKWKYKITSKYHMINYDDYYELEEFQILNIDCKQMINPYFITKFLPDTFIFGAKSVIIFYNLDDTEKQDVYTLQYKHGVVSDVNNEHIQNWEIHKLDDYIIDLYKNFLYREEKIKHFNNYYTVYMGEL